MSDKKFLRIVVAILIIGTVSAFLLAAYTIHKHQNASILTYIGNER